MTDNRLSGVAMIAGQIGLILTLSLHPSGKVSPAEVDQLVHRLIAVHSIALAGLPLMILGGLGLARALSFSNRLSVAAFVIYSFAIAASLSGIVIDGLVMPHLLPHLADAAKAATASAGGQPVAAGSAGGDAWRALFRYNGYLDMAFVQFSLVATAVAVIAWSVAMFWGKFQRGVGVYGVILGAIAIVALFSGALGTEHALMIIVFGQSTWFLTVGGILCTRPDAIT